MSDRSQFPGRDHVDRYVRLKLLAKGGMGAIYLGKRVGLEGFEKEVVLKELLPEFLAQPEFEELFRREAVISATLEHPNIVRTLDLAAVDDGSGSLFIVMEYVHGADLRTILKRLRYRQRRLLPAAAIYIARELLEALAYAHGKRDESGRPLKLIHRDISPSNIMVSVAGEVKLTDFGIVKASTHQSVFYRVKGKPGYMSPEQASGQQPLDHRSDLYALAVCLYEMLSGQRLYVPDLIRVSPELYGQPLPPLESDPQMPRGIDHLLRIALAVKPSARLQTALSFQEALTQMTLHNSLMFSMAELADFLRQSCGEDPWSWRQTEEPRTGTQLLDDDEKLSRRSLTGTFAAMGKTQVFSVAAGNASPDDFEGENTLQNPPRYLAGQIVASPTAAPEPHTKEPSVAVDASLSLAPGQILRHDQRAGSSPPLAAEDTTAGGPTRDYRGATNTVEESASPAPLTLEHLEETQSEVEPTRVYRQEADRAAPGRAPSQKRQTHQIVAWPRRTLLLLAGALIVATMLLTASVVWWVASRQPEPSPVPAATPEQTSAHGDAVKPHAATPKPTDHTPSVTLPALTIVSSPSQANVYIDDVRQCLSRCTIQGLEARRVYLLSIRQSGYRPWSQLVTVNAQAHATVDVSLQPDQARGSIGYLLVESDPIAEVHIDHRATGHITSAGRLSLPPGEYEVTLVHPQRQEQPVFLVDIRRNRTTVIRRRF